VRLALEQGEIDSLVRQAVERLSLQFPEEALPLLAEIAARTPGSFSIDQEVYQACTGHWMGKIAEARRLKEEGKIRAAAKTLVDAWDAYFDALGGEVR
jgi:regulator of sirC expression with transglutaminase-like and TPR domain